MSGLVKISSITTYHTFGYHGLFKPSVAEVFAQIPEAFVPYTVGFLTRGPQDGRIFTVNKDGEDVHAATTELYGLASEQSTLLSLFFRLHNALMSINSGECQGAAIDIRCALADVSTIKETEAERSNTESEARTFAFENGLNHARKGDHTLINDEGEELATFAWESDSGDSSVGLTGWAGWVVKDDSKILQKRYVLPLLDDLKSISRKLGSEELDPVALKSRGLIAGADKLIELKNDLGEVLQNLSDALGSD